MRYHIVKSPAILPVDLLTIKKSMAPEVMSQYSTPDSSNPIIFCDDISDSKTTVMYIQEGIFDFLVENLPLKSEGLIDKTEIPSSATKEVII